MTQDPKHLLNLKLLKTKSWREITTMPVVLVCGKMNAHDERSLTVTTRVNVHVIINERWTSMKVIVLYWTLTLGKENYLKKTI